MNEDTYFLQPGPRLVRGVGGNVYADLGILAEMYANVEAERLPRVSASITTGKEKKSALQRIFLNSSVLLQLQSLRNRNAQADESTSML